VNSTKIAAFLLGISTATSFASAGCKNNSKPAAKAPPPVVMTGSAQVGSGSAGVPKPAPIVITPPNLTAPAGPSKDLEDALAAWVKGTPDTVGLAVKGLVDWSKARGALPPLPPRPIDAQPSRYQLFKMARTLIETRADDQALVEATLYLAQRMRREASTMMEATFGGQLADAVISLHKVPPAFAPQYAPTDDEVVQAFAAEGKQVARVYAWQQTDDGKKAMAEAKAEAAKAGSNAGAGPTLPTDADQKAAIDFFAGVTKDMPTSKPAFLEHVKKQCEAVSASPSKLLVDVARILPQHTERMFGYVSGYQAWMRGELMPAAGAPAEPAAPTPPMPSGH